MIHLKWGPHKVTKIHIFVTDFLRLCNLFRKAEHCLFVLVNNWKYPSTVGIHFSDISGLATYCHRFSLWRQILETYFILYSHKLIRRRVSEAVESSERMGLNGQHYLFTLLLTRVFCLIKSWFSFISQARDGISSALQITSTAESCTLI